MMFDITAASTASGVGGDASAASAAKREAEEARVRTQCQFLPTCSVQ